MNNINHKSRVFFGILFALFLFLEDMPGQNSEIIINGSITESVTGEPLNPVLISVSGTGKSTSTDKNGNFEIPVDNPNALIVLQMPGYFTRYIYLNGASTINSTMTLEGNNSFDENVELPLGDKVSRDIVSDINHFSSSDYDMTDASSVEQAIQGKTTGLTFINQSGMPGHRSFMGIRGLSSLYGRNEPLVILDHMLYEIHYPSSEYLLSDVESAIGGFTFNPMDIVDIDDVNSITIFKDAQSYLGSMASNGVIFVNTEQKKETSTAIDVHIYQGVATKPKKTELMDAGQYRTYLQNLITTQNLSSEEINNKFSWLYGDVDFRYNNNTNWQDEIFRYGLLQKYHIFLKGGDNIATYNISTGYTRHSGIVENTSYSRFNLRINGKINITNKFAVSPIVKVGVVDNQLCEQGPYNASNPILAAHIKPPVMKPYTVGGMENNRFIQDVGVFNISNPEAIVQNLTAENRNFILMSSGKFDYIVSNKLSLSSTIGIDYNNARDNIFIPDIGLINIDSAYNTIRVAVMEYTSVQNNNLITYKTNFKNGRRISIQLGNRNILNTYHYSKAHDLNTSTDDFRSLGSGGSEQQYLRYSKGGIRYLNYISIYNAIDYSIYDKYYLNAGFTYDGNSIIYENNRFNFYPFVGGAWRIISTLSNSGNLIEDLKLRLTLGQTGYVHNAIYDYSHMYYSQRKYDLLSTLAREYIPNKDLEIEKKSTINLGFDIISFNQTLNTSLNIYYAQINNLIIHQKIPSAFGSSDYYDNGGGLITNGVDLTIDYSFLKGISVITIGGNITAQSSKITKLDFLINPENIDYYTDSIMGGGQVIYKVGEPLYSFYGYETDGILSAGDPAIGTIGPKGIPLEAGDVKFIDHEPDGVINDKDKVPIGNLEPKIFGGFYTNLKRKNLTFRIDFNYCIGNYIYNYLKMRTYSMDSYANQNADVINNPELPNIAYGDPKGNNVFSDRWIENGSYLRIKRFTVEYKFSNPSRYYKNLAMYITGSNLFTLSGYSGYDPEVMYMNEPRYMSVDYGQIPLTRSFIFGIKLGL